MSFFSGIGDFLSSAVNIAVTAWTGNPLFGQIAGGLVESLLSESGGTGNSGFDQIFNDAFGNAFLNGFGG